MRDDLVVGANFFDQYSKAVGRLESAAGRIGLIRGDFTPFALRQGELVYQGDVIEAGADGSATIRLLDGTTFHLGPDSSIAIGAFDPAEDSSRPSSVKIVRGKVGFFPGRQVRDGRLNVETPSAAIRGTSFGTGAAISAGLAALFILCLVEEANAGSEEITILDFDDITFKDLHHGTFEVITKGPNPQVIIVDDPGQTLVLHPRGSGFSIELVANTRAQMLDLQNAYKSAYDIFSLGLRDPFFQLFQRTASAIGSGGSLDADGFHAGKFDILLFAGLKSDGVTPTLYYRTIDQKTGDAGTPPNLVTIPATVHVLPISRFQIGQVDISPTISITFPPTYQKLISVTFSHVPAGYIFTDGNGHQYSGPSFTISAADFYSGPLKLSTPASGITDTYMEISARVDGLGGEVDSAPVPIPLTLDQDSTDKVKWTGNANTGLWETDGNWNTGVKPLPIQDVVVDASTTGDVIDVESTGIVSLNSLRIDAHGHGRDSVVLHITAGNFSINAADNDPFSNSGTVKVENSSSSFSVGNAQHPGQLVVNSGLIQALYGSIIFISVNVANDTGLIQIDAPANLNLQDSTIDSGELVNHGLIKVSSGASNSIHDLTSFVNDGELLVTGNGTTLLLSNETLNNAGGLVTVDTGAILNLTAMTIAGGTLSGAGEINVIGDTTLDGSSGHAVTIDTGTAVTIHTGTTLTLDGSIQGGGEISVAGASAIVANGTVLVPINAAALADDLLLTLSGTADLTVTNLKGDLTATNLSGDLDVTTADAADISIATGSGANTIDATALATGHVLDLSGDDDASVFLSDGDLDAHTDAGVLTVEVVANDTISLNSIVTGSNDIHITGDEARDDISVDATALGDGNTLTLDGEAKFTVTHLQGDLDAAGLSGDLDVTTADVADLSITTGSGTNTIDATALTGTHVLDLHGSTAASVTLTDGDLDAHTDTGVLTVEVLKNNTVSTNTITTGTNDIQVSGDEVADDITVDATALADGNTLTLDGQANFTVTHLQGDLDAAGLTGTLDVTTADVADLSITTGTGTNTIDATALTGTHVLNLNGGDDASVTLTDGDLDAHSDTGVLTVEVLKNNAVSTNTITTGTNDIQVSGDEVADDITVDATALADGNTLTLDGQANFTVTHLQGDLDAAGLTGALDVTTADVADLSITTGSGTNTIDATALTGTHVLNLEGDHDASVTLTDGDLDAHTDTGVLTVEVLKNNAVSTNTITTGTNDIQVSGDEVADDITVDATSLADGNTLTLDGQAQFTVTHLKGDLDAAGLTGTLDVTTADIAGAGTIDITTGSNDTSITAGALLPGGIADDIAVHAAALADGKTLTLTGPADFIVDHLVGDLNAAGLTGTLDVTTADIAGTGTIDVTTGSKDTSITAGALLAGGTADDIAVHAAQLADGKTLTLAGPADFTVDHLVGDLNAAGLTGTLDVTTADITGAGTIDITTGSNDTSITAGALLPVGTADDIAVHAAALADGKTLTLAGPADFTVDHLVGDLDAAGLTGTLNVTTADIAGSGTIDITTGSNDTSITAGALLPVGTADDIAVHAAALADGKTLTLAGPADFTVDHLVGDLDAAGLTGTLDVTTADIAGAGTIDITTGSNDTSITAGALLPAGTADDIAVHAAALTDGKTLTLAGPANFTVDHLVGELDASGLSGDLDVTTADVADLSITTGSGANTIDATALAGGHTLDLQGVDDASVSLSDGDLDAHTDTGKLTVEVVTNGVASFNTITTGSNDIHVTGDELQDKITVDAKALADGNTLTLDGQAELTVTHLKGDVDASGLSGDLYVTTANVADLSVTTGSGANTINAVALTDNHVLRLDGTADALVSLTDGNLNAATDTGVITVEVIANGAASSNTITTGSNDTRVVGYEAQDTILVNAVHLADGKTLTLDGAAQLTVTHLKGDLDASGLTGTLDVTTADIAGAGTIDITTGSKDTSITAGALLPGGTADDIAVHAAQLADGKTLTLAGPADFTVDHLVGDLNAAGLTGTLDVTTTDITGAGTIDITTGSNDTSITAGALQPLGTADDIAVDAAQLADGKTLTLAGPADFTVDHLAGDLDAKGLAGDLDVTTVDVADLSIRTGSGASTIDATALTSGHVLTLSGDYDASVSLTDGDLNAAADIGSLTVEIAANGAVSTNTITTGTNNIHITGDEAHDCIQVDAAALANDKTLTLDGPADFTVTNLTADLDAAGVSGKLDVTASDVDYLTITTGSGTNTIDATALADDHLLRLKGDHDASITLTDGNLSAGTDTGTLSVEVVANGTASSNTIRTGTNDIHITGDEAGDIIRVNAADLAAGKTLTLDGQANFAVKNLGADLDATTLQGKLNVTGTSAGNVIVGGSGNDTINGDGGGDTLTGGQGNDKFVFAAGEGSNTITDFVSGQDHIVLDGIFTGTSDPAFQAFLSSLSAAAAGVHDINIAGTTIVLQGVDVNHLHQSDFVVH